MWAFYNWVVFGRSPKSDPNSDFLGKRSKFQVWFCNSEKAHPCAKPRLNVLCVKVGAGILAIGDWKNPQTEKMLSHPGMHEVQK